MKKQALLAAVLLATGVSFAQAAETSANNSSVQTYFNGYRSTTQPNAAPANQEQASVAKSLAIGITAILGGGPRLAESVSSGTPNVAKSVARYTDQFNS
jgi:uncharacterized protein YdeI (BOF family)